MSETQADGVVKKIPLRVPRLAIAFGLVTAIFSVYSHRFLNDHFDRLARARQIARYGDMPFADFFDPGYFMTEISSAMLLKLFGDSLIGELLLLAVFTGIGAALVLQFALRISGSNYLVAVTVSVLSVLALPRTYDLDKVLFYPLGLLFVWRYVERPVFRNLLLLAAGIIGASLFRYDNGVYVFCSALAAIAIIHGASRLLAVRIVQLSISLVALGFPFLAYVQWNGGLVNAADQIVTYAVRERARSQITRLPTVTLSGVIGVPEAELQDNRIEVRWNAIVDSIASRRILMERHALKDEQPTGPPGSSLWSYRIMDTSARNLRALVTSDFVEEVRGFDKKLAALASPEGPAHRMYRAVATLLSIRLFPVHGERQYQEANGILFWILITLPVLALLGLMLRTNRDRERQRPQTAQIVSLIVLVGLLDIFILREPVAARVGGMAGPVAILFAYLAKRSGNHRGRLRVWGARATGGVIVLFLFATLRATPEWQRVSPEALKWSSVHRKLRSLSTPPPHLTSLVHYVRNCTRETDRVLAAWFVPELYFFAQRGFAAGLPVFFGDHWSEPRFQSRSISILSSQSVPLVFVETPSLPNDYSSLAQYLEAHYRVDGVTNFGNPGWSPDRYTVLSRRDRQPTATYSPLGLSCFR